MTIVRTAQDPGACLLAFLQSTYEAAARTGSGPDGSLLQHTLSAFD
jgi:hypothetical protein